MTPPATNLKAFSLRGASSSTIWPFTPSCVAAVVGCVSTVIFLESLVKTRSCDTRDVSYFFDTRCLAGFAQAT